MHVNIIQKVESLQENDLMYKQKLARELLPCDDCVFCMGVVDGYDDHSYICNLGLDEIFHKRNHTAVDIDAGLLGCIYINDHPTTPCKARYTDEEMQELLGV